MFRKTKQAPHWASRCTSVSAGCHRKCPRAKSLRSDGPPLQPGSEPRPGPRSYCCLSSSSATSENMMRFTTKPVLLGVWRLSERLLTRCLRWGFRSHLDKCDLACADVTLRVSNDHLAVVLQPALLAQHVVDARYCLVPLVVISIPTHKQCCIYVLHIFTSTFRPRRLSIVLMKSFNVTGCSCCGLK